MAVCDDAQRAPRCKRYERAPARERSVLTPQQLRVFSWIGRLKLADTPQLARACELSRKGVRRTVRPLYNAKLVDLIALPRAALADPDTAMDASWAYGSAPNIWTPTRAGLEFLIRLELIEEAYSPLKLGPANWAYLAHELLIRDARIWLECCQRTHPGHTLERWEMGEQAIIDLARAQPPRSIRPDASFAYRVGQSVVVAFLEIDRGTERGDRRWAEKATAYSLLLRSGRLPALTGYSRARVLVVTPSPERRDAVADVIARTAPDVPDRFWLATTEALTVDSLDVPLWRTAGHTQLQPLVPPQSS